MLDVVSVCNHQRNIGSVKFLSDKLCCENSSDGKILVMKLRKYGSSWLFGFFMGSWVNSVASKFLPANHGNCKGSPISCFVGINMAFLNHVRFLRIWAVEFIGFGYLYNKSVSF